MSFKLPGITISDGTLARLLAAANEEGVTLREHCKRILAATAALYAIEDRDGKPAGPRSEVFRPVRWTPRKWKMQPIFDEITAEKVAEIAPCPPPGRRVVVDVAPAIYGDPPPGRSALDQKRAAAR